MNCIGCNNCKKDVETCGFQEQLENEYELQIINVEIFGFDIKDDVSVNEFEANGTLTTMVRG